MSKKDINCINLYYRGKFFLVIQFVGLSAPFGYQALYQLPSKLLLMVKIHLHPIDFFPLGRFIDPDVWFFNKALIFSSILFLHFFMLKSFLNTVRYSNGVLSTCPYPFP